MFPEINQHIKGQWIPKFIKYYRMFGSFSKSPNGVWTQISPALQWRHNGRDDISNHQPHHCFLSHLFRRRSKKTSKLHVTGLCVRNSPVSSEFPSQMPSNAENVSIWWRHHEIDMGYMTTRSGTWKWTFISLVMIVAALVLKISTIKVFILAS